MSRDVAPWPATTLTTLRDSYSVGLLARCAITWQADPTLTAPPVTFTVPLDTLDIMEDATGRPLTRVTAVTADRALFTQLPPDAWRERTATVALFACYADADLSQAPQLFGGSLLDVEDTGTAYRITAVSIDATDDLPHFGSRMVPRLWGETPNVGLVIDSLDPEGGSTDYWPPFASRRDHPARPPIRSGSTSSLLEAMALDTGDNLEDYVAGLLDCYPNACQLPSRDGLRILVSERITPTPENALDLRAGQGLTLTTPTIAWGPDDWGNVLRLTATWRGSDGRTVSQTVTRAHESVRLGLALVRVVDVRRAWRPPGDNINNAGEVPTQLLNRLYRRSWRASLQAKPVLWLRPGDPVRVTDDLYGVVASIRHTLPGGLAAITVRPI